MSSLMFKVLIITVIAFSGCGRKASWKRYEGVAVSAEFPSEPELSARSTGVSRLGVKRGAGYKNAVEQMVERPNKKVSRIKKGNRLRYKDYWRTSLKAGEIEIHVEEASKQHFNSFVYEKEVASKKSFLTKEYGDELVVETIQLDGVEATTFEYPTADGMFTTQAIATNKDYSLEINITGYKVKQRKTIRDRFIQSIRWDGPVLTQEDGN